MSYISDVRSNVQQIEYQKFVQIEDDARFPPISVIRNEYADSSTASVSSLSIYPKTAVLTYLTNASDIKLTLSASEVDIGNVGLVDHYSTGFDTYASVIYTNTAPGGQSMGAVSVKTYGVSPLSGLMTVQNPTSAVAITNTVTISTAQTLPVSGSVTILNPVSTVNVTGSVATNFNPTQVDAFNRLRVSNPLTLFDSSHRFRDNNLWSSLTANGGTVSFNLNLAVS